MTKARILADFISDGSSLADGTISVAEVSGAAPLASPTFTGTASGTFSGPLTGAVTGNVTGAVTGNVTGNLTGDVLGDLDLTAISATIADTAVDVFVYDTSKDSDGGAWRKRTQGTSWYNETLGTGTRGSRKEFPSVAVIVAESTQVTIYDGDDPALPMWMVFNSAGNYFLNQPTVSALTMLNGKLAVTGTASNHTSLAIGDFVSEFCQIIRSNYDGDATGLVNRNQSFWSSDKGNTRIVSNAVNDVAMTVLPNAPIDAATGLPVPTIAVATDGGVSVIKDDGTVVDINYVQHTSVGSVHFNSLNHLLFSVGAGNRQNLKVHFTIPSSDQHNTQAGYQSSQEDLQYGNSAVTHDISVHPSVHSFTAIAEGALGSNTNLVLIDKNNTDANYLTNFITSDHQTGWMNGDIKLATLSDTDDTDVTGSNITSGDAATDDSNSVGNWTGQSGATATVNSNGTYVTSGAYSIRIAGSGASAGASYYETGILTVGKTYVLSFNMNSADGDGAQWQVGNTEGGNQYGSKDSIISVSNTWYPQSLTFTATSADFSLLVFEQGGANSPDIYVDDMQLRLAEEDRSVNGNGLQVFGTITKTAVATGADLVAYSGFSTSNYLQQPYNSDLDFGTGDFSVMGWVKTDSSTGSVLLNKSASGSNVSPYFEVQLTGGNYTWVGGSGANAKTIGAVTIGTWQFLTYVRKSGVGYAYLNASLNESEADTNNYTSNADVLRVGLRTDGYGPYGGSLALWRISATAPSPEQIAKIYEDEKVLFQENAQATLYGSSDAVTALAYDDTTELLHVGTSEGRSVFQGLRRVDNTTSAVGAAISASNGLVAED
jgi:trimeric autotransporter adhesin